MTLSSCMWFLIGYLMVSCVQSMVRMYDTQTCCCCLNAMKKLFDLIVVAENSTLIHPSIVLTIIPIQTSKNRLQFEIWLEMFAIIYFMFTSTLLIPAALRITNTLLYNCRRVMRRNHCRLRRLRWGLECLNRWSYSRNNFLLWRQYFARIHLTALPIRLKNSLIVILLAISRLLRCFLCFWRIYLRGWFSYYCCFFLLHAAGSKHWWVIIILCTFLQHL